MKISKIINLVLSIAVVAMFIGCGTDDDEESKTDSPSSGQVTTDSGETTDSNIESTLKASTIPFIIKVNTDDSNKITIGYGFKNRSENQSYSVDWGDGTSDSSIQEGDGTSYSSIQEGITHTYPRSGVYTISISGIYPIMNLSKNLVSIEQWGDMQWTTMKSAFAGNDIIFNASDLPNLTKVTDMSSMYRETTNFNQDLGSWDVSTVTNMGRMFYYASNFNQDIGSWDVSNVTNMDRMFQEATNFNQDLSSWDVSNVTDMYKMFSGADNFNADLSSWDVSNVTDMGDMFSGATSFNQDISSWDVSNATSLPSFSDAKAFNQDISGWNILKASHLFLDGTSLSTANYDKMLMSWVNSDMLDGFSLAVGDTKYSKQAESAKFELINKHGWKISDGGLAE